MQGTDLIICCIYDSKAEAYMSPFVMRSDGEAIRAFGDAVAKGGTPMSDHPEDYHLYRVGTFDQQSGLIVPCDKVTLAIALDFKREGEVK